MKDSDMEPELAAELDQERLGDAEVTGGEGDTLEAVEGPEDTGEGGEVLGEDMARRDPETTSTDRAARRSNTTDG
jgi:hypothetical protein